MHGTLNDVFPHKVCINLERRPDRWQQMQRKLEAHGIRGVERVAAVDGQAVEIPPHWRHAKGAYGCLRSHVEVVDAARRAGAPSVLIFEDDVVFDQDLHRRFEASLPQLPADWDMLYFGALHKDDPLQVSGDLARLTKSNSTYAYAIRDTVFDAFLEINRRADDVLDNNSFLLQQRFNCYCFMPHLAWVETDWSDAQTRLEHHWYLKDSLVLFGASADRLLGRTTIVLAHEAGTPADRLLYLAGYYHSYFSPFIELVIVEQGAEPSLPGQALFLEGAFDPQQCFEAGILAAGPARDIFLLSDDDVYLETLDFRANLRMCERYDGATGYRELVELTPEDSLRLRAAENTRGLDVTRLPKSAARRECRFLTRDALQTPPDRRRLFHSPNHALHL